MLVFWSNLLCAVLFAVCVVVHIWAGLWGVAVIYMFVTGIYCFSAVMAYVNTKSHKQFVENLEALETRFGASKNDTVFD